VLPALEAHAIALFAISYDAVGVLAEFAAKQGIRYPLLSDEDSQVMRRLNLINERVQDDHAFYGIPVSPKHANLPYPGVFVLDRDGRIEHKRFHESYRERDTGAGLIAQTLGILDTGHGAEGAADGAAVRVRVWLDSPTYCSFQRLHLNVEVAIAPGFHVYASPVADGYTPLSVDIAPLAGLEVTPGRWPAPHRFALDALAEEFWVYEGTVLGTVPFAFTAPPGQGDQTIEATVRYQACSASACFPAAAVRLELAVREVALVGRSLPARPPAG
jgi:hypothetical protein